MRLRLLFAPIALLLAGAANPQGQPSSPAAQRIQADVSFLSSDLLEGRDTGSRGYDIGAAYVVSQFRAIGLQPGGTDGGWYQTVPFRRTAHASPPTATLTIAGKTFKLGNDDFSVRPSLSEKSRTVEAPLVFVGHGISDPRLGLDEYAGLDVRGKIVVALEGTPAGLPSEVAAHLNSWKSQIAAEKGAIGLIQIAGTGTRPNFNLLHSYDRPVVDWVDPTGKTASQSGQLRLTMAISSDSGARLLKAANRQLDAVRSQGRTAKGVQGFALPATLRLSDSMQWNDFQSPEVIGVLPGSDPALKDQYVVLMGHLDHLGVKPDAKPGQDAIYNGALDNAAGVATMLEAAREFVASGKPPKRSVLFIANTGEEKGLRGADYFAAHPTVPESQIVGVVDLDMPLLLYAFNDVIAFGAEHSTVAKAVASAAKSMGVAVSPDPMPEETIFVRSDHYRFVTRGIPGILLMTGYGNGGAAVWKDFLAHHYHQVSDDLSQPIQWEQGARYAELNYRISRALADEQDRPMWYEGDYFGDSFAPKQPRATR
jgi:hypothetical protein